MITVNPYYKGMELCPKMVASAVDIPEEIIEEHNTERDFTEQGCVEAVAQRTSV